MKVLVTGGNGMLARAIGEVLGPDTILLTRDECDVRDVAAVGRALDRARPDVIVHAAAWTDVDACERDEIRARAINIAGTQHVAMAAATRRVRLIAISTDYVFSGRLGRALTENDSPEPLSVYGRTKLASEGAAIFHHSNALILRTAATYGPGGRHFPAAIARLVEAGEPLEVVADQIVSPTYVKDVAEVIGRFVKRPEIRGVFHCANTGTVSWFDFAREVLSAMGKPDHPLTGLTTAQVRRPAKRPPFSALDSTKLQNEIGILIRSWEQAFHAYVNDCGGRIL